MTKYEREILYSCIIGDTQKLYQLMPYVSHLNFEDEERNSPLLLAVINEQYSVIELLIKHGADLHHIDGSSFNLLNLVKTEKMFNFLLDYGMDVHLQEMSESSPFWSHGGSNNDEHIKIIRKMLHLGVKYTHLDYKSFSQKTLECITHFEIYFEKDKLEQKISQKKTDKKGVKI